MKQTTTLLKKAFALLLLLCCALILQAQTVVWQEDFEGDWTANWHVDAGTWEVGTPTSGLDSAYAGDNCAATVLATNYPIDVNTRLIRHTKFVVPEASENPRLRFRHWYSFSAGDYGKVQIKVDGTTDWVDISTTYNTTGGYIWTYPYIDLIEYAGSTVQIAFYIHSDHFHTSYGWFIDDIVVMSGSELYNNPESWEFGLGDWASERGTWEVGIPSNGPGEAYSGKQCAATNLGSNYNIDISSRLISPKFVVPEASENPRLRFWHWYSFSAGDYGKVQIKVEGTTDWIDISTTYNISSGYIWTYPYIDLNKYAGSTVQIAFYIYSDHFHTSHGWFIDDIELVTGSVVYNNPEGWESGLGDWASDKGTWEIGTPLSGPGDAYSGTQCAATKLNSEYNIDVYSRLISPKFVIPEASENPRLRFWHWYSFSAGDYGQVQLKLDGATEWVNIASYSGTSGNIWSYPYIDLYEYAGSTVQLAFYCHSDHFHTSHGWFIDDIVIEPTIPTDIDVSYSNGKSGLLQNHPNPFGSYTQITYSVQKPGLVSLVVHDSQGAKVSSLINAVQPAGEYTVGFEAENLPSGMYFYSLQIDNTIKATKKMVIVK